MVACPFCREEAVEPIWKKHWPRPSTRSRIRLPENLLPATLGPAGEARPRSPCHPLLRARDPLRWSWISAVGRFAGFLKARGYRGRPRGDLPGELAPSSPSRTMGTLRARRQSRSA